LVFTSWFIYARQVLLIFQTFDSYESILVKLDSSTKDFADWGDCYITGIFKRIRG